MGKNDKPKDKVVLDVFVKMRFPKDMYYTDPNVPLYKGGAVVEVPEGMVDRWLKRGGVLVKDEVAGKAPVAPVVPPKKEDELPPAPPEGEGEKGNAEKK